MKVVLVVSFIIIAVSILTIVFVLLNKNKLKKYEINKKYTNGYFRKRKTRIKAHRYLLKIPFLNEYILNIRNRLYIIKPQNEIILINKALGIAIFSIGISVAVFIVMFTLYGSNVYMTVLLLTGCVYLNAITVNALSGERKSELLINLPDFIGDIKHNYHSCNMVDEAVYEATERSPSNVAEQGKQIYKVLTKSDGQMWLEDYYNKCPNKFLKILAGFSYLIKEFGDKKINGISMFVKNLNYITEEIYLEIIKSKQLNYQLKGLSVISLIPLVFMPFIESWMSSGFPEAKEFFNSSTAFFLKNTNIFLSVFCCFLISQIKENENKEYKSKEFERIAEYKLLKIKLVSRVIDSIKPVKKSSKYFKMEMLLREAGSPLNIECIYLRRIIFGFIAFVIIFSVFLTSHQININAIVENSAYGIKEKEFHMMLGKIDGIEEKMQSSVNRYDKQIIDSVSNFYNKTSENNLKDLIGKKIIETDNLDEDKKIVVQRIFNKITDLKKEKINFLEILFSILFGLFFSYVPIWVLLFAKNIRKVDMQDEVCRFHTIIILLMHHKNVDVRIILEWMSRFSDMFKGAINRCLNNFHNPYEALQRMKEEVKFKDFVNLVDNLQMAIEKIDIASAFDALEVEREFYKENRKEINKQTTAKKIEIGKLIGFIPFYSVIILYMVVPLILTSLMSLKTIIEQLSTL